MQVAELHQKLREKDETFKLLETNIASLKEELSRAQSEIEFWRKRAEKTPAIQVLESELQDVKVKVHFVLRSTNNLDDNLQFFDFFLSFFNLEQNLFRKAVKMKLPS